MNVMQQPISPHNATMHVPFTPPGIEKMRLLFLYLCFK